MIRSDVTITLVNACLRDGLGGSPTAVLDEVALSDEERRAVPVLMGTSHAVFVSVGTGRDGLEASVRFFTATGELPACGHGTVAALAFLADRSGDHGLQVTVSTAERAFTGWVTQENGRCEVAFDAGVIAAWKPTPEEQGPVVDAVGVPADALAPGTCIASLGRARLLVPVATRSDLGALAPDMDRLRDACDHLGFLGCYVYCVPTADGRLAARMFAPSIGVPEDVANANSTACLAAWLARGGMTRIAVDMGDAFGLPSTITAAVEQSEIGARARVGGAATIASVVRLPRGHGGLGSH